MLTTVHNVGIAAALPVYRHGIAIAAARRHAFPASRPAHKN
jgi:hypothetical protein